MTSIASDQTVAVFCLQTAMAEIGGIRSTWMGQLDSVSFGGTACGDWHTHNNWEPNWEHMFGKILRPNYLQNVGTNATNARKSWFLAIRVICVVLHFFTIFEGKNQFNRSHAHSVCLNLPSKHQGLQPRTEPLLCIGGFLRGQSRTCFSKDCLVFLLGLQIAAFFSETPHYLKRLEFSMQLKLEIRIIIYIYISNQLIYNLSICITMCSSEFVKPTPHSSNISDPLL